MKKMKKFHLLLAALLLTLLIPVCKPTIVEAATLKAPKTLTVKQGKNNIAVQWSKVPGAKGYVVYRKNSPSQGWKRLKVVKAPTLKYLDKSISSGKSYYYTVRPYTSKSGKNSYGFYNKSGRNTVYLKEPKVSATKSHKSVTLKWNKTTGASGYEVYRKSGSSGYSKVKTTAALSYKDTAVEPNTKYTYAVRAYKKSGSSVFRSLYYDDQNLVDVKTNKEPEVTPEPEIDINDAVKLNLYPQENHGCIIELDNTSIYDYNDVRIKIDFYDSDGTLVLRIPQKLISNYLGANTKDYARLVLPQDINYTYYKALLTNETYDDNYKFSYLKTGSLYVKGDSVMLPILNTSDGILSTSMKIVLFHNNIPTSIDWITYTFNVRESAEINVFNLNPETILDTKSTVKVIIDNIHIIK